VSDRGSIAGSRFHRARVDSVKFRNPDRFSIRAARHSSIGLGWIPIVGAYRACYYISRSSGNRITAEFAAGEDVSARVRGFFCSRAFELEETRKASDAMLAARATLVNACTPAKSVYARQRD
jgi:hypothetical protein